MMSWLIECLFTDNGALLLSGAETAVCAYQQVSKSFGVTVS